MGLVFPHRQPCAADAAGVTAKFRNGGVIDADADVVDAGAAGERDFARRGDQAIEALDRRSGDQHCTPSGATRKGDLSSLWGNDRRGLTNLEASVVDATIRISTE